MLMMPGALIGSCRAGTCSLWRWCGSGCGAGHPSGDLGPAPHLQSAQAAAPGQLTCRSSGRATRIEVHLRVHAWALSHLLVPSSPAKGLCKALCLDQVWLIKWRSSLPSPVTQRCNERLVNIERMT